MCVCVCVCVNTQKSVLQVRYIYLLLVIKVHGYKFKVLKYNSILSTAMTPFHNTIFEFEAILFSHTRIGKTAQFGLKMNAILLNFF